MSNVKCRVVNITWRCSSISFKHVTLLGKTITLAPLQMTDTKGGKQKEDKNIVVEAHTNYSHLVRLLNKHSLEVGPFIIFICISCAKGYHFLASKPQSQAKVQLATTRDQTRVTHMTGGSIHHYTTTTPITMQIFSGWWNYWNIHAHFLCKGCYWWIQTNVGPVYLWMRGY